MNEIKLFENPMFGEIRSVELYEQVYFVAKDVTNALGYTNSQDAVKRHCRWVAKHDLPHPQAKDKTLEVNVIPKGDVIRLVSNSKLPAAQEFESWIFDEVIPNVMESGKYEVQPQVVETQQAIEQPTSNSELSIADRIKMMELISNAPEHAIEYVAGIAKPFMSEEKPEPAPTKAQLPTKKLEPVKKKMASSAGHTVPFNVKRLRNYLVRNNISQSELVRMSGVSSGVISSAITGKQKPGLESRGKICVALGKSVDWLNGGAQL